MLKKEHLEELARFIRENRISENNFEKLYEKLVTACKAAPHNAATQNSYAGKLHKTLEKHAATYKQKKEQGISAWPEFLQTSQPRE